MKTKSNTNQFLRNMKISTKIIFIVISALLFMLTIISAMDYRKIVAAGHDDMEILGGMVKSVVEPEIKKGIANCIKVSVLPIEMLWKDALNSTNYMTESLKKNMLEVQLEKIKKQIRNLRYGENGEGYLFVTDEHFHMVIHPVNQSLENKDVSDLQDPTGIYIFREIKKQCIENDGEAFIAYSWPKTEGGKPLPKLTYAKYLPDLKWYVCTGFYMDDVDRIVKTQQSELELQLKEKIANKVRESILTGLVSFISVGWIIWYSVGILFQPMNRLKDEIDTLAKGEGDLTLRLPESKSELGILGTSFNRFIATIQKIVSEVKRQERLLFENSESLLKMAKQLSDTSSQLNIKSNTVAASAENVSGNINNVAVSTEQTTNNIANISSATEELSSTATEIASNAAHSRAIAEEAVGISNDAASRVNKLTTAVKEINTIVSTIEEISSQTNLLALNATIEAARAGSLGKGFAVVANEIKELAKQTAEATSDIKDRIKGVEVATGTTTGDIINITTIIGRISESITGIAAAIEEQSSIFNDVSANMSEALKGVEDTAKNIGDASVAVTGVARDMDDINRSSLSVADTSRTLEADSKELSKIVMNLQELLGGFTIV